MTVCWIDVAQSIFLPQISPHHIPKGQQKCLPLAENMLRVQAMETSQLCKSQPETDICSQIVYLLAAFLPNSVQSSLQ